VKLKRDSKRKLTLADDVSKPEPVATADLKGITNQVVKAQDRLVLQASDLSLETLASMVDAKSIDIGPSFQRRERWDAVRQGALIESFLLNIPVPPIYLAEEDDGSYTVIDGQQRLRAITAFMRGDLALTGLERLTDLNSYTFRKLPLALQNPLRIRPYIRAVTLLKQSDPDLRYEVFTRLNTGGVRLNPQELRNVAFRGPLNDLIYKLSGTEFLKHQLKITSAKSSAYREMADAEYVLRYLTLLDTWEDFSGDLARSMDQYMKRNRHASAQGLQRLNDSFTRSLRACESLWGAHAFQRPAGAGWRDQALAGMYDAQMIAAALTDDTALARLRKRVLPLVVRTRGMFADPEFDAAVRVGTNTPSRVRYRIRRFVELLQEIAA
jgi:hypothetical protein